MSTARIHIYLSLSLSLFLFSFVPVVLLSLDYLCKALPYSSLITIPYQDETIIGPDRRHSPRHSPRLLFTCCPWIERANNDDGPSRHGMFVSQAKHLSSTR